MSGYTDAVERTGKDLRVTFNYRYVSRNSKIKELLMEGVIGEVKSVHFGNGYSIPNTVLTTSAAGTATNTIPAG